MKTSVPLHWSRVVASTRAVPITNGRTEVAVDVTPDLYGTLELHAYQLQATGTIVRDTHLVIVDAAMNDLVRPAMYGSYHAIVPVRRRAGDETPIDIVGPICESSDVFATARAMSPLAVDDLVAILDAGAYGSVMASNYNRHLLPAEVLVDDGRWSVIRRRQTLEDVLALEQ